MPCLVATTTTTCRLLHASRGVCDPHPFIPLPARRVLRAVARQRRLAGDCEAGLGSMASEGKPQAASWLGFPFLPDAGRALMEDLAAVLDTELSSSLNDSRTPSDVRSFKNPEGNGVGSVVIRSGKPGSKIDFILRSWLHCNLPVGGDLNIITLIGILNLETDTPHLQIEFIQNGPENLVLVLDLLPRKDLVLHPEYLKRFYEDTGLDRIRQEFEKASQAQRYVPSVMYIRTLCSPTAIMCKISGQQLSGELLEVGLDRVISHAVYPTAKKVIKVWLEGILTTGQCIDGVDREILQRRDIMIKTNGIERDLSSNMPILFGQDIADRVIKAFRKGE